MNKIFSQNAEGQGEKVPAILKKLRQNKAIRAKNQRIVYSYRYDNNPNGEKAKVKTFVTQK